MGRVIKWLFVIVCLIVIGYALIKGEHVSSGAIGKFWGCILGIAILLCAKIFKKR